MGNSEEEKSSQTEKTSPPEQANIHVYPDWAAMQMYYGPRVAIPPYYNPAVASGHTPHPYMWGPPQPMMPPYAALYSPGGVYTHPAIPIEPHPHGQGVPSSPATGTPLSMETPPKSANSDRDLMKKLKGFDGLAMSIGNGHTDSTELRTENKLSQSVDTGGSSDGSDGNTAGANQTPRKRSCERTPATNEEGKPEMQANPVTPASKETAASNKNMTIAPASVSGQLVGSVVSSGTTTALELRNPSSVHSKTNAATALQPVLPAEAWMQNERELKRERRKQSNRDSARRSRLRKQAETEELARKVESLSAENVLLKSEINRLTESSEKMRVENATLGFYFLNQEKLKNAQMVQTEGIILKGIESKSATPMSTENLLSRVNNNSSSNDTGGEDENGFCDRKSNIGPKLYQLLDTSPRADAVAAG
ncbi:common plant regulatory factor 1 isoform X1 [Arachis ipaensis]|uniref:common plant regulatory factor 1 isoform X1 n=2 Tax=Arachis ipaensis TaxID=130454 RepID=UPI000A2B8CE2|nr:common plant regulatory factor 1 isoform X1 [Arachis ipaensis]XP_020974070.1 common plant regulatory factor 1 isoform X1 [Arachis ipaensis]XP_020974074.1 common plant regulatory factor 1 isoform X1 [Arachis ipaensis]XP_020974078.1 common plant regulatory factor 1 isoform X1 [Arachis ipaensis]